ncbi:MAG: glycosyl transferase group 1, partial [Solirubrobacterales bacterium]|nr:glycosyl transferase group 1 [Solirubrobacterales bacterium]
MRIAVEASVLHADWGGIPKYVDRIVRGLVEAGDEVDLLANSRRIVRAIPGAHDVGMRVKGLALWREVALPAWLAAQRPDVLWGPATALPRLAPVPTVVTVHDLAPVLFPGTKPQPGRGGSEPGANRRAARQADRVIAVSGTTARDVERVWDVDPAVVRAVALGVDERFCPGDRARAQAEVEARWGLREPWVLAAGSLEPRKGLDVLIAAAALAARTDRLWRVALAGQPAFRGEEIATAARATGACSVLGPVSEDELLTLFRAADLLAVPSLYEGFGLTPLEAMACGTPVVIAGDSGGLEEVSGPAARIVRERTPAAWAEAVDRV